METGEARAGDGSRWLICRTTVPSPSGITRSHKAVGSTTAIAVALPLGPDDAGRIYAGLPVADAALSRCISAPSDPIASRQALDDTPWNRALNELVGDPRTAAALWPFRRDPARARRAVPLPDGMRDLPRRRAGRRAAPGGAGPRPMRLSVTDLLFCEHYGDGRRASFGAGRHGGRLS